MPSKVEYRVRPVVRYIVTRHEQNQEGTRGTVGSSMAGEYPNYDMAYAVGYALCKREHDLAGTPPGDENFIYPDAAPPSLEGIGTNIRGS